MKRKVHRGEGNPPEGSLRWAVAGLLVLGLLTRAVGLLREVLVAGVFGADRQLDAVLLGLSLPLALALGFGGGGGRAIVPAAARLRASRLGGLLVGAWLRLGWVVFPVALGLIVTGPVWSRWMAAASPELPFSLVQAGAAMGCLAFVGGALSGVCIGLGNARGRHLSSASTAFVHNGLVVLCVALLHRPLGVWSFLLGVVLAEWLQCLALLPVLRRFFADRVVIPAAALARAEALFWPAVVLATTSGFQGLVDRWFAAGVGEGAVAALAYAERLLNLPVLLLGMALQQPFFTRLSQLSAPGDSRAFDRTLELGLRVGLLLGVPGGIVLAGLAEPLIGILLQRGAFTAHDTALAAEAMRGWALSIAFLTLTPLLLSAGLARGKAWSGVRVTATLLGAKVLLNSLLAPSLGLLGITLATSLASLGGFLWLVRMAAPGLLGPGGFRGALLRLPLHGGFWLLAMAVVGGILGPSPEVLGGRVLWLLEAAGLLGITAVLAAPLLLWEWRGIDALRRGGAR